MSFRDRIDKWLTILWLGQHGFERWKNRDATRNPVPPEAGFTSTSMVAFGVVLLLNTLLLILITRSCSLDLSGLIVVLIGWNLSDGNRSAAQWGIGCMGWILCMALLLIAFTLLGWAKINQVPIGPHAAIWALPVMFVISAWSAINLRMCIRILRYHRRRNEGKCGACGYPVGDGFVCTECGAALQRTTIETTKGEGTPTP